MAQLLVTATDSQGNSGSIAIEVVKSGASPLVGDVSGTFGDCFISGDVNLTGDLIIEGLLTGVDSFTLEGNGFQLLFQNGGRPQLAGVEKSAWVRWGDTPVGWQTGDRVAVAPTAAGVYVPSEIVWGAVRPVNSPDVTLPDGSTARPEVVNLTQTIVLQNLRRIHFHDGAGVASLRWLKVLNSGVTGVLSNYPIHFHLCGETVRGSVLEGVVVEGGKNHAFVPHGSHGITQRDCVAYKTKWHAFWWDKPIEGQNPRDYSSDPQDLIWDHCLALGVEAGAAQNIQLAGFWLGSGKRLSCTDSAAACVSGSPNSGSRQRSGFHWPEAASDEGWVFQNCVSHNNAENGIFTWQNTSEDHLIEDFALYRNGYAGLNHGAYSNFYHYERGVIDGPIAVVQHAKTTATTPQTRNLVFEDFVTNGQLVIPSHNSPSMAPTIHRRCTYSQVVYKEPVTGANGSYNVFEDCGLVPADFDMAVSNPGSIVDIVEGGVLVHQWQSGSWT